MSLLIGFAALVSAFDLDCTGTKTVDDWEGFSRNPISKETVNSTLRVDLASKLWCSDDCSTTAPIVSVDDATIVFKRHEDDDGDEITFVNRRTGQFTERERLFLPPKGMFVTMLNGTCSRRDFSGFPPKKF